MIQEQYDLLIRSVADFNKWREENPKEKIDLSGADLRDELLRETNLSKADLSGSILQNTILQWADMHKADLSGTDLRCAIMSHADLRKAIVRSADMRLVDIHDADLSEADMRGADMRGAIVRGTKFLGADLRWAIVPVVQFDQRGFALHIKYTPDGLRFVDGIYKFTLEEALAHWGADTDKARVQARCTMYKALSKMYEIGALHVKPEDWEKER